MFRYKIGHISFVIMSTLSLLIALFALDISPASAAEDRKIIITYYSPPGPPDIEDITNNGGRVRRTYTVVPSVAAVIPGDKVNDLYKNSNVKKIDDDIILYALAEVLP